MRMVTRVRGLGAVLDPDREVLDHRVGEQLVGDLPGAVEVGLAGELDLDPPTDADGGDVGDAEPRQRVGDRLALRIEDLRLEHDVDDDASHGALLTVGAQLGADPRGERASLPGRSDASTASASVDPPPGRRSSDLGRDRPGQSPRVDRHPGAPIVIARSMRCR